MDYKKSDKVVPIKEQKYVALLQNLSRGLHM